MPSQPAILDIPGPGLSRLADPSRLVLPGQADGTFLLSGMPSLNNLIPTLDGLRTAYGRATILGNKIYIGGTSGKLALIARSNAASFAGSLVLAVRQHRLTGTATATVAGYLVDAAASFTPDLVGHVIRDATGGSYTVITRFMTPTTVAVADNVFALGDGYWVADRSEVVAIAPYLMDGNLALADLTVLGELNDDQIADMLSYQNRLVLLSGANRGAVVYKNSLRALAVAESFNNNGLSVDLTQTGALTGSYQWAVCISDEDALRVGPPLMIDDAAQTDRYYAVSAKRLVLSMATLPTPLSALEYWTHYLLFRKKSEWADFYLVARILKTASTRSANTTAAQADRLWHTGASFTQADVGMWARNTATGQMARVTELVGAETLVLDADIFRGSKAYVLGDGTTTSTAASKLIDGGATFTSALVGKMVHNQSFAWAEVTALDSPTQLSLSAHIFTTPGGGDYYTFGGKTTATATNRLIDTKAAFSASDVGRRVHNNDNPPTYTVITTVNATYNATVANDIFGSGEGYVLENGRTTSYALNKLVDLRASFVAGNNGKPVYNESGTYGTVTAVDGSTQLSISGDLFPWGTGEAYTTFFGDNLSDALALSGTPLIMFRNVPAGCMRTFLFRNRLHWYGGYKLALIAAVSVTKDSAIVTLSGGYTTDQWMIGKYLYCAVSGTIGLVPYRIRNVRSLTQLELDTPWLGESITDGDAMIRVNPNRILFGLDSWADCEFGHAFYELDVAPDDGDEIIWCCEVDDRILAVKRNAVYMVTVSDLSDPVGMDVPDLLARVTDMGCSRGAVGPFAAVRLPSGAAFWFAGESGVMAFGNGTIASVSDRIGDLFLSLDQGLYYWARMLWEPQNNEIILSGLRRDGETDDFAVAMNLDTGVWREIVDIQVSASCLAEVK